jgi:hypothetical protein
VCGGKAGLALSLLHVDFPKPNGVVFVERKKEKVRGEAKERE